MPVTFSRTSYGNRAQTHNSAVLFFHFWLKHGCIWGIVTESGSQLFLLLKFAAAPQSSATAASGSFLNAKTEDFILKTRALY